MPGSLPIAELGFRNATLPVTRLATAMHDGNDENEVWLNRVQHTVRKDPCETAPDVLIENAPACRRRENSVERPLRLPRRIAVPPPDHAPQSTELLPRTLRALPGGTHISSLQGVAHLATCLRAGNRFDAPGAHFIPPPLRLSCPQLVDAPERFRVKAFDQEVCDTRTRLARELQGLCSTSRSTLVAMKARYGISSPPSSDGLHADSEAANHSRSDNPAVAVGDGARHGDCHLS